MQTVSLGFQVVTIQNLRAPSSGLQRQAQKNTLPASQGNQCKRAGKVTLNIQKV